MSDVYYHFKPWGLVVIGIGAMIIKPTAIVVICGGILASLGIGILRMRGVF